MPDFMLARRILFKKKKTGPKTPYGTCHPCQPRDSPGLGFGGRGANARLTCFVVCFCALLFQGLKWAQAALGIDFGWGQWCVLT